MKTITKLMFFTVCLLGFVFVSSPTVSAEGKTEEQFGDFKDDKISHYYLDAVPADFAKDKSFLEKTKDKFWFLDMQDKFGQKMNELFNFLANTAFELNMFMTRMMITAFDIAYNFEFVNSIINKLDEIMAPITGITGTGAISNSGLFGNFAKFVAIVAVIYAVYTLIWKRSMFSSISTIFQTTVALSIAVLLFTNYSSFLTGLNQVTTEASALILSGHSNSVDEEDINKPKPIAPETPTGLDETNLRNKMRDNLWSMFVDRPYLYMMYGVTDMEKLNSSGDGEQAKQRVKTILKEKPHTEERYKAIEEEINKNNIYLTYNNISKRLSFTPMYLSINGITSIPIYFLALTLILFQFWFMIIALFAPFALLIGAIPGQINVLKRYFLELGLPLMLKVLVAFAALIVFALSELLYQSDFAMNDNGGNAFFSYVTMAIVHFVLFMLVFLLRKRIGSIFTAGSKGIKELREGMGTVTQPFKKGMQGASTVTGLGIGALSAGGVGAMVGANIGSSVGKMTTGEGSFGEVAKNSFQAQRILQLGTLKTLNESSINRSSNDNQQSGFEENYSEQTAGESTETQLENDQSKQVEAKLEINDESHSIPETVDWIDDTPNIESSHQIFVEKQFKESNEVGTPFAEEWIDDTPELIDYGGESNHVVLEDNIVNDSSKNHDNENMNEYEYSYANLISLENHMPMESESYSDEYASLQDWDRGE